MTDADSFLSTIFDQAQGAVVVTNGRDDFRSRRWKPGKPLKDAVYFCISTVVDSNPRAQILQRRTQDLVRTYVVILDDVGTKVPRETVARLLAPSYRLETSPGNEQWGYILDEGCEPERAAALIQALAAAGLTDPGSKRADRVMRFPGSLNGKYTPPFAAALLEWHPARLYSYSEIAAGLGVVPTDTPALGVGPADLPEGMVDPLFQWLLSAGLVLSGPNPRGWYALSCPQEHLHTGEVDHGTDYRPGLPGVFKCMHGHCVDLNVNWLRSWVQAQDPKADLSLMPREALEGLGKRLADALGVAASAGDGVELAGGSAPEGLFSALLRQAAAGSMFAAPAPPAIGPVPVASDWAQLLAWEMDGVWLDASVLPNPDLTQGGKLSVAQKVTAARVHKVMDLIGLKVRENVMTGGIECKFVVDGQVMHWLREEETPIAIEALLHACTRCGMSAAGRVYEIVALRAMENRYSPVAEWICSKPWDGRSRIAELCASITMRIPAHNRWRDVALRRWLIQGVSAMRNWEPCEDGDGPQAVGYMLVLQGEQGQNKSRWIESLLPKPWVTIGASLHLDKNERDAVMKATMTPITELGELDGSFRRTDISALKAFLTSPVDRYRMAYARKEVARPRCTSFAATVNPAGFLIDPTGARRFWPLAVRRCEPVHGIDLQQLWAEVWTIEAEGEVFWLCTAEEEALHKAASSDHAAPSDVSFILEDLKGREGSFNVGEYVHANAKDLCQHYLLKGGQRVYVDLNAGLEAQGYRGARVRGKQGFYVPPYTGTLSAAQRAGLQVLQGGKRTEDEG